MYILLLTSLNRFYQFVAREMCFTIASGKVDLFIVRVFLETIDLPLFDFDIWIRNDWSQKRYLLGGDYFHPSPEADDDRVVQRL